MTNVNRHGKARDEELIYKVVTQFFAGRNASEIRDALLMDFPGLTRESIYPLLMKARALNFIRLVPPVETALAEQIKQRYPGCRGAEIVVVKTRGAAYGDTVSTAAADVALELLRELGQKGAQTVGLGLGPGKATLDFAKSLSASMDAVTGVPQLDLFGITAGCIPDAPEYAPISFFNLFPDGRVHKRMALFAETLVRVRDFARVTKQVGVKEAFRAKKDIRIIVTGLGDARDEHDLLTVFLRESGKDIRKTGAIGNVQYRPFTRDGVLRESADDLRAVTLFELDELVELCKQKDHHVILIARQCGRCGMIRSDVVRALLERESLRVFSHLVMDLPTAEALVMSAGS